MILNGPPFTIDLCKIETAETFVSANISEEQERHIIRQPQQYYWLINKKMTELLSLLTVVIIMGENMFFVLIWVYPK